GHGVGLCPLDHPTIGLDHLGCWRCSPVEYVPKKPIVFVNLFNNQWNTNFRLWNGGTWTSRVRLWSATASAADCVTPAMEARHPVQVVVADGPAGPLPATQAGLSLSRTGLAVTAFGSNPDGAGILLRIWEQ